MSTILRVAAVALCSSGGVALRKRRHAVASAGKVVTIGDSYSAGTGIHNDPKNYDERYGGCIPGYNFTPQKECQCLREEDTTPGAVYAASHNMESIMTACFGAQTPHHATQMDYLQERYPDEAARNWNNSIILLTAGGNDLRSHIGDDWPTILRNCIFKYSCESNPDNNLANEEEVKDMLTDLFSKLAQHASAATIRVMGYPYLMQRVGGSCRNVLLGWMKSEADWMDGLVDQLEEYVHTAVNRTKAAYPNVDLEFVSVLNYLNLGACSEDENRHVNGAVLRWWGVSDSSFHPTQKGFDKYYEAFVDSLR